MNFFEKYKKILLLLGFLLVVFLLAYAIYSLFFKTIIDSTPLPEKKDDSITGALPENKEGSKSTSTKISSGKLPEEENKNQDKKTDETEQKVTDMAKEIVDSQSLGVKIAPDNSIYYYNNENGKFYSIKNGVITALSEKVFYNVKNITWSPDATKAVLEYPDGANIIYDFQTKKQITLPNHWQEFNFSPNSRQLVLESIGNNPDNYWLAIVNSDGSGAKKIENITDYSTVYPSWSPNNQIIAMYTEGIDFDRQEVFFVGLNNENFRSLIIDGRGFQPRWSPDGNNLLYSVYSSNNNFKPNLWIASANGDNIGVAKINLGLETWAEKCVFADSYKLYCAVPDYLEEGSGLFRELAENTSDSIYEININTKLKKIIYSPSEQRNMSNLIINGKELYFTDSQTKKIYKINLK